VSPSPAQPLVLVLPGAEAEHSVSIASVHAEGVAEDRVLDPDRASGALAGDAELIAFIRPGDRWLPGQLEAQRAALEATPEALLSAGRHRRRVSGDRDLGEYGLIAGPIEVAELALRCPIEASAAAVRPSALDADRLADLAKPGGDVALWCGCAAAGPVARVDAVLAEVRWDSGRHGFDVTARIERLRTLSQSPVGRSGPAAAAIRRELLARIYLEGGAPPDRFDAAELAGDDGLSGVVADLQWTLERQGRQLAALWSGWPHAPLEHDFSRLDWPEDEVIELTWKMGEWASERGRLDSRIQSLTAQVRERDAYIRRFAGQPGGADGNTGAR
jgi:hypothetical protein